MVGFSQAQPVPRFHFPDARRQSHAPPHWNSVRLPAYALSSARAPGPSAVVDGQPKNVIVNKPRRLPRGSENMELTDIIDAIVYERPDHLTNVVPWHGHIPFSFWC